MPPLLLLLCKFLLDEAQNKLFNIELIVMLMVSDTSY